MNVFVYGTLKRGHCRAHVLQGQNWLGAARTEPVYRMYDCGDYPGLVHSAGGNAIEGEVWDVDSECLSALDEIECLDEGLYRRDTIRLQPPFDQLVVVAYFYEHDVTGLRDCGTCWSA